MKKIVRFLMILAIVVGIHRGCFSQNEAELNKPGILFSKNVVDETVPVSLSTFYGSDGWGGGITFRFMQSWRYQHFGFQGSQQMPIDLFYGFMPVGITNNLFLKTDIGFGLKTEIDMRNLEKTLSTFGANDGIVLYLSPGLLFEAGRFELSADYRIGQLFSKDIMARWYQAFQFSVGLKF